MPDVFTKAKRSDVMSRIRSRGNADTELALVRVFRAHRITGWRRHIQIRGRAALPRGLNVTAAQQRRPTFSVRPDFVFRELRLAVFVDGCFWHACPRHCRMPAGNGAFWRAKLARNQARDRLVTRTLRKAGWRVLRIWEHTLRWATTRKKRRHSTPHPSPLPVRGGEGAEARLLKRIQKALDSSPRPLLGRGGEGDEARLRRAMAK